MSENATLPLLKDSPLVEVVYSMQAISSADLNDVEVLAGLKEVLAESWTISVVNRLDLTVRSRKDAEPQQESRQEWQGFKCTADGGKLIAHHMRDGLFVNFLRPYTGFEFCIKEVQRQWELHQQVFQPERVVRTGIRYINLLNVPLENGGIQFDRYFRFLAHYPIQEPFQLHRFHHQFEVTEPEFGLPTRVIFTSLDEKSDMLDVVLDIETYDDQQRAPQDSHIWMSFDRVQRCAYKLFTNTLTKECLQRYQ